MTVDTAYLAAQRVLSDAQQSLERIRSEEDAKLQIITRLLTEVLGWSHSEIYGSVRISVCEAVEGFARTGLVIVSGSALPLQARSSL